MRMRTSVSGVLLFFLALLLSFGAWSAAAKELKLTGEVVCLNCYVTKGLRGEAHVACGKRCVGSGLPVGLRDDRDRIHVLIGQDKPLNKTLAPLMGQRVVATGQEYHHGGVSVFKASKVEKVVSGG
jgi:hypothetical protein